MKNRILSFAAAATIVGAPSLASAQQFSEEGGFVIAAERLFGFTHVSGSLDPEGPVAEQDFGINNFGFLGQGYHEEVASMFTHPRAAFDFFIIDGLSLGGSLSFWVNNTEVEDAETDRSGFVIAPRVGYAAMFSDAVGIWPRGGFSFFTGDVDGLTSEASLSGFAFDAEAPFVFIPADHVAILAGPSLDVALGAGGEVEAGDFEYDASIFHFGLYAGLAAWF